jgi:hypothetical protein
MQHKKQEGKNKKQAVGVSSTFGVCKLILTHTHINNTHTYTPIYFVLLFAVLYCIQGGGLLFVFSNSTVQQASGCASWKPKTVLCRIETHTVDCSRSSGTVCKQASVSPPTTVVC